MPAISRKEMLTQMADDLNKLMPDLIRSVQGTAKAAKAWRKCIAEGREPVYLCPISLIGDTTGINLEITPPEGWVP